MSSALLSPEVTLGLALAFGAAWTLLHAMVSGWMPVAMDTPNERSLHQNPTPRTGGLAICLVIALLFPWPDDTAYRVMGLGALALAALSLADDFWNLSPLVRFPVHLFVAAVAVSCIQPAPDIFLMAVSVLAIVWMTNLFNFMDGSNGLAGGMALFGFAAYALASLSAGAGELAFVTAGIVLAALAFLFFNFHPARIFMGDSGSIPLGFLAGIAGYLGWVYGLWPFWFPVVVFAPFVADASVTLAKRILARKKIWRAHREHYYQRLIQMGWSHRRLALWEYALMLISSGSALLMLDCGQSVRLAGLVSLGIIYMVLMVCIDWRWRNHVAREASDA